MFLQRSYHRGFLSVVSSRGSSRFKSSRGYERVVLQRKNILKCSRVFELLAFRLEHERKFPLEGTKARNPLEVRQFFAFLQMFQNALRKYHADTPEDLKILWKIWFPLEELISSGGQYFLRGFRRGSRLSTCEHNHVHVRA